MGVEDRDRVEVGDEVARVAVVGEVFAVAGLEDAEVGDEGVEGIGYSGGVAVAGGVSVGDDDDAGCAFEPGGVVGVPGLGAACVAGGGETGVGGGVDVGFAFADVDGVAGVEGGPELGEAVGEVGEAAGAPAGGGGVFLPEGFLAAVAVGGMDADYAACGAAVGPVVGVDGYAAGAAHAVAEVRFVHLEG
ncbi:hypothetical protein [Nocardia crassostreae]|uniref:hypothetical protein n=1 Tax=Nocardia crassostreae TaxID=53428 RepID=UPI000829B48F|nr:hypothetical protein [Nocardia crassostreae]